ncbi:MAG: adenylate/guanylate cyclase domain-containing protein, partial [Treponema sp.]|nr:adenylate/guanylate cyclase domain-containing protein [Treponema sp.]
MAEENENKEKPEKNLTVKFPIGVKLVLIISFLIIISLGSITYLVNFFVSDDVRITAENTNFDANSRSASVVKNTISQIRSNALLLLDVIANSNGSEYITRSSSSLYFDRNPDTAAVVLLSKENFKRGDYDLRLVNNKFFAQNELDEDQIEVFISTERETIESSFGREVTILNATPFFNYGTIALLLPWNGLGRDDAVVIITSTDSLNSSFGGGSASTSFVINNRGDVLIHPDFETMRLNANFSDSPLIIQMRKNNDENRQILYKDADGKEYFGAYQKLELGDLGVLTTVQSELIFENVRATTKRNIYLTLAVLFVSVILVWFWSLSLSRPLKKLTGASVQIEA